MLYRISFLFTVLIFLTGCSNTQHQQDIEKAAQGYLDAMGNYRIDDAAPYATLRTREKTIPTLNYLMAHSDTAYINSNRPATITLTGTTMLSDTSARVYYHKSTPLKESDDSILVVLEEGQWLVDVHIKPLPFLNNEKKEGRIAPDPKFFGKNKN